MKITKYDVHVHAVKSPQHEIVGKYFFCSNDNPDTIKSAIANSSDQTFKPYLNDKKYIIHMVSGEEVTEEEAVYFAHLINHDRDPEHFFISKKKIIL